MTVLQLVSSEGYYGVESMLVALAKALSTLGCDPIMGVFRDSRNPHMEVALKAESLGVPVEVVPCDGRFDWKAVVQLRKILSSRRVNLLHTHGYKADLYGYVAARTRPVSLLATCHNWPSEKTSMRLYAALDRQVVRRFGRVVTPSPVVAGMLQRAGVSAQKLIRISNGVDLQQFDGARPALRSELRIARGKLVGFVGRLVPDKGGTQLLRAAQKVLTHYPDTTFVFVGDGPARREWQTLAREARIHDHVVFLGNRSDMPSVYASLDMLVLPSLNESMPMCLLEAMAARTPVIATRVGAIPEMVRAGVTGLLVSPGNDDELARAILRLLEAPDLARRLAEQGYGHVVRHFSSLKVAARYLELYKQVIR